MDTVVQNGGEPMVESGEYVGRVGLAGLWYREGTLTPGRQNAIMGKEVGTIEITQGGIEQ